MPTKTQKWQLCVSIRLDEIGEHSSFSNLISIVYNLFLFHYSSYFSDNEDPMVRGLALRSLCSLRLESILEYIEQPLQKSFTDLSAYVRKTGVLGVLKVLLTDLY